ncbi:MAG: hypothetical protein NTZ13_03285 [Candidatus Parcubacteria bacterium]|nr:hypothetical protein [Candidatus Parcubacteria bacterium]
MKGRDKQGREKGKKPLLTPEEKRRQKRERKQEKTTGERFKEQMGH